MSVNIVSPVAGSTVAGNPLKVNVHFNTTERLSLKSKVGEANKATKSALAQAASQAPNASSWRLACTVARVDGTPGHWQQAANVMATGDPGNNREFEFWDGDDPIPDSHVEIIAELFRVISLGGGFQLEIPWGSDTHKPVQIDT